MPIFDNGCHNENTWTIYHDDCLNILKKLHRDTIDCIVTSPPYFGKRAYGVLGRDEGNTASYNYAKNGKPLKGEIGCNQSLSSYYASLEEVFRDLYLLLKDKRCFFLNIGIDRKDCMINDPSIEMIRLAKKAGFLHRDTIIWIKRSPRTMAPNSQPYYLDNGWEYLLLFTKGKAEINRNNYLHHQNKCEECGHVKIDSTKPNYFETNLGFIETSRLSSKHPAKFPQKVPSFALSLITGKGDIVLDPFCGIGTTLVAGLELGLDVIGCELNETSYRAALSEIENFTCQSGQKRSSCKGKISLTNQLSLF